MSQCQAALAAQALSCVAQALSCVAHSALITTFVCRHTPLVTTFVCDVAHSFCVARSLGQAQESRGGHDPPGRGRNGVFTAGRGTEGMLMAAC